MNIAINARFSGLETVEGYGRFTNGLVRAFHQLYPQHPITLLYDRKPANPIPISGIDHLHGGPMARHPLLWKMWYDFRLPILARQTKADLLFSPDGFCSLTTSIPQVLAIHDLAFLHYPQGINRLYQWYYRHYTPKFIRKARHIITVSDFSREDIIKHYPEVKDKISVIHNAADPGFRPIDWSEKEVVRQQFTQGVDYFLYAGAIHPRKNLINLLKGFSWFKNRHRSSMKMVLAGRMAWGNDRFTELLNSYKYRDDIILTGYISDPDLQKLMASAYALVYPSYWEGFGLPVLEAMQCGIPVITSTAGSLPEIVGAKPPLEVIPGEPLAETALICNPDDHEALGKAMGIIYKDETLRSSMIAAGLKQAAGFNWETGARTLYDIFNGL